MTVLRLGTAESHVLSNLDPTSSLAIGLLIVALLMVIAFEATNGFHDAANAVATVIYTKSLTPVQAERAALRNNVYEVIGQLKHAEEVNGISSDDKKEVKAIAKRLGQPVEYAPWWVRILSALCLGIGTMIGYKRIVTTLGARLGKTHMTPAQGASAETVSAALISFSGFSGFPVSTTHIVTSGIAGTMVAAGSKLQWDVLTRILIAWLVTLPVTIFIAAGIYYLFENPAASIAG